jgi:hypothetical protein
MKIRLVTLLGLAISFALPIFAQQTDTPDPQLHQQLVALFKKFDEVWNSNDQATWVALFVLVLSSGGEARENWSIHGVFGEAERL